MRIWASTVLVLIAVLGAYRHGVTVTDNKWKAAEANSRAATAERMASADADARAEEMRRQLVVNETGENAREQNKSAAIDAADADRAGQRLRTYAKRMAAMSTECSHDARASERSEAATRAAMVLSDLLERADRRAGELAAAYDRAKVAGLACEKSYNVKE